jgi:hypothetical protein
MIRIIIRGFVIPALIAAVLSVTWPVFSQEEAPQSEGLFEVTFHHVVFDMVDSIGEVTEMLIFQKRDSTFREAGREHEGLKIAPAEGFSNLRLGGEPSDWEMNASHDELRYVAPPAAGMNRLVLSYDLMPEGDVVEFLQDVVYPTGKYVFVTSNPNVELESPVLTNEEFMRSGEGEVRGLSNRELPSGTRVRVFARVSAPSSGRSSAGFLIVLMLLLAVSIIIYATARMARTACTGDARLVELEERRESIEKSIGWMKGEERRAGQERLGATERLIDLIVDIRKRGTGST